MIFCDNRVCRSFGGLSANEKKGKNASKDNNIVIVKPFTGRRFFFLLGKLMALAGRKSTLVPINRILAVKLLHP